VDDEPAVLARWLATRDFLLIDEGLDSSDGGTAALVLDIDAHPVVAAFTSRKYIAAFVQDQPELFDDLDNVKVFIVEGRNVVLNLPEGGGIVIDPASDDEQYLEPELVDRIREELSRSM
jgi:hypothetical protein